MKQTKKYKKYERLYQQIRELIQKSSNNPGSNMSTIIAVLHHKIDYFFWTGFYFLMDGKLQVGPYQGSLACIDLKKDTGVCWAAINKKEILIVDDVYAFPGHISCDARSASEIVIPLFDEQNKLCGVMDVDSRDLNSFDETDAFWLEKISKLVFHPNS
jgi:GAF domain-containing protein